MQLSLIHIWLAGRPADRNKFIMRGVWLRSKEKEETIMTLSMKEKKILYAYGCPSHHNLSLIHI